MSVIKNTLRKRLKLLCGTPRRLFLSIFLPGHVQKSLSKRRGKCLRCGACCQLVWKCRYFRHENGIPSCALYNRYRPPNCRHFPINKPDIADRDLVSPHTRCGFWWTPEAGGKK
ncbi:MAG: hypothetical protein PHR77_12515 [Kiritimatiellae bacterium]|nr:hypothetical protein [Kiritimatiellia bacterium]MDD5522383.1 hypothetical protein [Kiritimatiellia bacterium]